MQHTLTKTKANDPTRCQFEHCVFKSVEGTERCPKHGGANIALSNEKQSIRTYRLSKFQARLEEFANDPNVKSLREEIGILRILMEEKFNSIATDLDLIAQAGGISDLCMKIEKLVSSCQRIEKSMGQYLDKNQVTQLGTETVQVIAENIKDPDVIEAITDGIITIMKRLLNESKNTIS